MTPAEYELMGERKWEALVTRVAERLRIEHPDLDHNTARRLSRAALHEIERDYNIKPLQSAASCT